MKEDIINNNSKNNKDLINKDFNELYLYFIIL